MDILITYFFNWLYEIDYFVQFFFWVIISKPNGFYNIIFNWLYGNDYVVRFFYYFIYKGQTKWINYKVRGWEGAKHPISFVS